jgi:hypothetical protein
MLFLDRGVLPHQRCRGFTHEEDCGLKRASIAEPQAHRDFEGSYELLLIREVELPLI